MQRSWVLGGVGGLLLASSMLWGRQGVVKTQDGAIYSGDITEHSDQVTVDSKGIHTTIPRDRLRSLTYSDSIEQEFHNRLSHLTHYDVPGRIELAQWLFENKSFDLAMQVLDEARQLQPRNADVGQMIQTVLRQEEMEESERRKHAPVQLAAVEGGAPAPTPARTARPAPARMLSADEINLVKQDEWQQGQQVRATFRDDVRRKYMAQSGVDPADFNRLTPSQQAWAIVQNGTPEMKKDVLVSDPPAIQQFKKVQQQLIYTGCANCHGGERSLGNFALHFPAESDAATYTNFIILQKYEAKVGDRSYFMLDRERPGDSLLIQFALPLDIGQPPHPKAANYNGAIKSRSDMRLKGAADWIASLTPVVPDYSALDVSSRAGPPTRPATPPGK